MTIRPFSFTQEATGQAGVTRFRLFENDQPVSYAEVIELWQHDGAFRSVFANTLRQSPYLAYRWETPGLSTRSMNQPFEFVLVDYPSFAKRKTDPRPYRQYFVESSTSGGIVNFPNLSGDCLLVVPSPLTHGDFYGHLAAFVRHAPIEQVDWLWRVVGQALAERLNEKHIWLSTAGGGVAWLHVRLDRAPKYYAFVEYRNSHPC